MITKRDLRPLSANLWEIPRSYRQDMRVPARVYASQELLERALEDLSLQQLVNAATLPGVVAYTLAMPDLHQGYGFPVGGVAATELPDGVISPGAIGYDINCGVRLLASELTAGEIEPFLDQLADALNRSCPSGTGRGGGFQLSPEELGDLLTHGARWCFGRGLATAHDLEHTEEQGCMAGADPSYVSTRALDRAADQLGTLGAGNHFLEVDRVTQIYDPVIASAYGLRADQIVLLIHCGSRGLGHQICTDYVRDFQQAVGRYGIILPDRELVCAPLSSPEARAYVAAMHCAANFAFANRQTLAALARDCFQQILGGHGLPTDLRQVYDVAHNMGKFEQHSYNGQQLELCVHRKGATRAFGPGSSAIPAAYRPYGQPVLVPGSMGTASYVLAGTAGAMSQSFGSTCHGAGRLLSRTAAKRQVHGEQVRAQLKRQGIHVRAGSMAGLAEEAPFAYKSVDAVVAVVAQADLARMVARLEPLLVIKG